MSLVPRRTLETPAERLAVGMLNEYPDSVVDTFWKVLLVIALKLECGLAPTKQGRG